MKKLEKRMSMWKALKINCRGTRLITEKSPQLLLSQISCEAWNALTPYVTIYLSALILEELDGDRNMGQLMKLVLITLLVAAGISGVRALLEKWRGMRSEGMFYIFREIFSDKFLEMDYVSIDNPSVREEEARLQMALNSGGWGFYRIIHNLNQLFSAVATLLGGIALTFSLFTSRVTLSGKVELLDHPLVELIVIAVMCVVTWLSPVLASKGGSFYAKINKAHGDSNRKFCFFAGLINEKYRALDMRIYHQERIADRCFGGKEELFLSEGLCAKMARGPIGVYRAASAAVAVVFTGIAYLFVCLKAWAGAFGIGAVTQYVGSVTKLGGGVSGLIRAVGDMRNNAPFLERAFAFLDIPNTMYKGSLTVEKRRDRDYEVEFRNVSFKYPGSETYALKNVNMKFKIGQRLAVVGRNGSGKTTFIKLLCRLYDPTEGEILLNGIDIRKYNYKEYMDIFSVVFQDFKLFALTIGQNVAVSTEYDSERAEDCLEKAGFGSRLAEMEAGLETYIYKDWDGSGIEVSGGEAQKIAIARTLYKDAPFIILDEPTAALDPVAEAEIYSKFNEIVGDKTAIYISHRLSSCVFCDEILVFQEGSVVQQGSHVGLLSEEGGAYRELWNAQAQYYQ